MKKNIVKNGNGIAVCDSIVMSVKNKRRDMRRFESVIIAVVGLVSVIMSFLGMFSFEYSKGAVASAVFIFSVFYITLILINQKALWVIAASLVLFAGAAFKMLDEITEGFKFVYNVIYQQSFKSDINYYKYVDFRDEERATTILFIFGIWLIAFVIYFFTIYHPNMILPLLVTFPVIEIGLYNGIAIPVFWGSLTAGYWIAMFCMTSTDMGEYSGGSGGFVRKNNVFSPKRQMKLKVTEKCGIFIILSVMIISSVTSFVINISGYERSDELNQKRRDLTIAFEQFSIENLAESLSRITGVFGLSFKYNNNKLGNKDHITYKDKTDLLVTFDRACNGSVYLKESVSNIYNDNEWLQFGNKKYNDKIFDEFSKYKIFPQDFPCLFSKLINPMTNEYTVKIDSKVKKDRIFAPYGTDNVGGLSYNRDMIVSSIDDAEREFNYSFVSVNTDAYASMLTKGWTFDINTAFIANEEWQKGITEFCSDNDISENNLNADIKYRTVTDNFYNNGQLIMAALLENKYRDFVYDNYLQLPDDKNMKEVRKEYNTLIAEASEAETAADKIAALQKMREKMAADTKYTLSPGKTPSNRDFVNYFLLENQKGYCIHYATSGVLLARMAGIPARYATGYVIVADDFNEKSANPDGSYTIDVKDNRSHAWVEIYLDGFGWVPYEFTAGYTERTINHDPVTDQIDTSEQENTSAAAPPATTTANNTLIQTSSVQSPSATTSSVRTAAGTAVGTGHGKATALAKTPDKSNSGTLKLILLPILTVTLLAAFVFIRRIIILRLRHNRFTRGSSSERIDSMYRYSEHLFAFLKLKNDNGNYTDFAKKVEQRTGGNFFPSGDFSKFMDIAMKTGFSSEEPGTDEIEFCAGFVNALAGNIYKKCSLLRKIWLKIGSVMI